MNARAALLVPCIALLASTVKAFDCSGDGIHDFNIIGGPVQDCDGNGWPDACDFAREFVLKGSVFDAWHSSSFMSADLDSDGDVDLGVSGDGPEVGFLLFNDGTGLFPTVRAVPHPMGDFVLPVDLDADGDTDLLVPGGGLRPHINQGQGVFVVGDRIDLGGNGLLGLGDLDADGDPDIAGGSTHSAFREVVALPQESTGVFGDPRVIGPALQVSSLVIEDLDADGRNDVGIASELAVFALLNKSMPFLESAEHAIGSKPLVILAGDTDVDGDQDLVTVNLAFENFASNMSVLENEGNGTYSEPRNYEAALVSLHPSLADMDGDRDPDVIGISQDQYGVTVVWNEGDRTFRVEEVWKSPFRIDVLEAVDLDGDGDLDVAAGLRSKRHGVVLALWNLGGGRFQSPPFESEEAGISGLAAGDFDGDGDTDLVGTGMATPGLTRFENEGGLLIAEVESLEHGSREVNTADLDADGDLDLALIAGGLRLFSNGGTNGFEPITLVEPVDGIYLAIADLDANGLVDLVTTGEGSLDITYNRGHWLFRAPERHQLGAYPTSVAAADLQDDGNIDLLGTARSVEGGRLTFLRNIGDGSFSVSHIAVGRSPTNVTPGDLDNDGDTDIVIGDEDPSGSDFVIFDGRGDGTFGEPERWGNGSVEVLALNDLDSDGDLDIAVGLEPEEQVVLYRNTGSGAFRDSVYRPAGRALAIVAADFDQDGATDLALGREERGLLVLHNAMRPGMRDCNGNSILDSCDIAAGVLLDVDGDGVADDCGSIPFTRGDVDMSVEVNITDAVRILSWLFTGGESLPCRSSADADDNAAVDLTDAIFLLRFLFLSGDPPPPPFPRCGKDPTIDDLGCGSARTCPG